MWFLSHLFTEDLLQKASKQIRPLLIGSTAVTSHAVVNSDARSIQISKYSNMLLCNQLQCNKAKLLEPALMNGLHIHRAKLEPA